MLDTATYRQAFDREAGALATAAALGLEAPVPSCPGWTVAILLGHLTAGVYGSRIVALKALPADYQIDRYEDLGLPVGFKDWLWAVREDRTPGGPPPQGLLELFRATVAELGSLLYCVDPATPIRTWWPPQQTAGFLQRRMLLETAIHRWDAQLAHGQPEPIEPELAADGIDEIFDVLIPGLRGRSDAARSGAGETYHFHRTDGPGEWLIRFAPDGPVVTREHRKGDAAIRGSASDLFLFLWHRIPANRLETFGDPALLDRYFELAPPA